MILLPASIADVLERGSDELLVLMRAVMLLYNAGPAKRAEALRRVVELNHRSGGLVDLERLGLVQGTDPAGLEMTALGKQVCDGAKQYVNWLDHADELPRGVRAEMVRGKSILDVGCGVGCAMLTFGRHGAMRLTGADLMPVFPAMARSFARRQKLPIPEVVLANGAALPFQDASFDMVFCRLALNYMRTDDALAEMSRICRPGSDLVICLNCLPWDLQMLRTNLRRLRWRSIGFDLFKLLNGVVYHSLGRQITLHLRGKMHGEHSPVFHTPRTLTRCLDRHGFTMIGHDADRIPSTPTFHARRR